MAFSPFVSLPLCPSALAGSYGAEVSHNSRRSLSLSAGEKRGEHGQGQPQFQRAGYPQPIQRDRRPYRRRGRYRRRPRRVGGIPQQGPHRLRHRAVRAGLPRGLRPTPRHRHRWATLGGQGHGSRRGRPQRMACEGAHVHHRGGARGYCGGELHYLGLLAQSPTPAGRLLPLCAPRKAVAPRT